MREIRVGDILIRFLLPFSVWHYAIVVDVLSQNAKDILVLEFADQTGIAKVTMIDFMYGRQYTWIDNFDAEVSKFKTFPTAKRIERAYKMFAEQKLCYTINKYNCEYYVRRCIFRDPANWISKQTKEIGRDKLSIITKLAFISVYGAIEKYVDLSDCERDMNKDKFGYKVCLTCGDIAEHNRP
jgi:hypothetical protein